MPASGRQIQNDRPKVVDEERVGIGADRVERDVAEIEQAGEADDDVEAPAEHHVGQDQDAEIDPVAGFVQAALDQVDDQGKGEGDAEEERHREDGDMLEGVRRRADRLGRLVGVRNGDLAPPARQEGVLPSLPAKTRAQMSATRPQREVRKRSAPLCSVRKERIGMHSPSVMSAVSAESLRAAARSKRLGTACSSAEVLVIAGAFMAAPQTFSTSGRPRMPEGMKISTMARIENAATSLYSIEK